MSRPKIWDELLGQEHLVGKDGVISKWLSGSRGIPSLLLWGPPGTGKSSIANLISQTQKTHKIIASEVGLAAIKKIVGEIEYEKLAQNSTFVKPLIFVDEFHRLNKTSQDALLGPVEEGLVSLLGVTTENPFYFVNKALLSRVQVLELKPLSEQNIVALLERAYLRQENLPPLKKGPVQEALFKEIFKLSEGDARRALNILELILATNSQVLIELKSEEDISLLMKKIGNERIHKRLDENSHYRWISDYIKAMRRGDEAEAIAVCAKLIEHNEDPLFIVRRMIIFAAEDVGLASPSLLPFVNSIYDGIKNVGMPEGRILLSAGTLACSRARKSREAYDLIQTALKNGFR